MLFADVLTLVQSINTGASNPSAVSLIAKIVLGKISRHCLPSQIKKFTINNVGLQKTFLLGTSILCPDFMKLKTDGENNNKCVYFYQATNPTYFPLVSDSRFTEYTQGYYATLMGNLLKISSPTGINPPDTIYFNYYSKFLVLDKDDITYKETPTDNQDQILIPSQFDDILIEGILLYLERREKTNLKFIRGESPSLVAWEKSLQSLLFNM
jgi:hypothetical protein